MPSKRKFYRTIVQIEVLSENPLPVDVSLEEICHEITEGGYSGRVSIGNNEEVDAPTMAKLLQEQASDTEFFCLTQDGEDTEET